MSSILENHGLVGLENDSLVGLENDYLVGLGNDGLVDLQNNGLVDEINEYYHDHDGLIAIDKDNYNHDGLVDLNNDNDGLVDVDDLDGNSVRSSVGSLKRCIDTINTSLSSWSQESCNFLSEFAKNIKEQDTIYWVQ